MEHRPASRPGIPHHASDAHSETSPGSTTTVPSAAAAAALSPASSIGVGSGSGPPQKRARTAESAAGRERERAGVPRVSYPKKRVNVACEVCRSRKTRCDAARPSCSFCSEIGARCVYRRPEETSRPDESPELHAASVTKGPTFDEHEVISRLARIEGLLQHAIPRSDVSSHGSPGRKPPYDETPSHLPSPQSSHDSYSVVRPPQHLGTPKFAFGFDLTGMARLSELPVPPELTPLCVEQSDLERQLRLELSQDRELFSSGYSPLDSLDLDPARCRQLRDSFASHVLPWCPILDQRECADVVTRTLERGLEPYSLDTAMTLLVLAGGAFARESQHFADDPSGFPGLAYFRAGVQIIDLDRVNSHTLRYIQCNILSAIYLLYCLRPVHAYEAIHRAALRVTFLLQLEGQFRQDPAYRQACLRAYWACYLIEHELQVFVPWSSQVLQDLSEGMGFPSSDHDEPGMYFFLAEITLRRIFSRPRHGTAWNQMYSVYEPLVAQEVSAQVTEWHGRLPESLSFPLGEEAPFPKVEDPQRAFLRAQYFAVQTTLFWPYVVRLLSLPASEAGAARRESSGMDPSQVAALAARSLRFAVVHMSAVEPLLRYRHVMLLADQTGTYTITMLLVCAYGAEALRSVQHPGMREAILMGWRFLKVWEGNPGLRGRVARVEGVMRSKGILEG